MVRFCVRAGFNYACNKPKYCTKCTSPDMVDVNNRKCIRCNVTLANFNYDGEQAQYCATCKLPDMVDVRTKRCIKCNVNHL